MIPAIQALADQLSHDVKALGVLSQNVANQSTVGYRAGRLLPDFASEAGLARTAVSLNPGPLQDTGRPFDLAIDGGGFFALGSERGLLLTRAGQFQRSSEGLLTDAGGRPVLGENGPLEIGPGSVEVTAAGELLQDGRSVGRLLLLRAADGTGLQPVDGGLQPLGPAIEDTSSTVRQGALEGANVDPAAETVALMALTRHVESVQRALSIYDRTLETGINRLGEN